MHTVPIQICRQKYVFNPDTQDLKYAYLIPFGSDTSAC